MTARLEDRSGALWVIFDGPHRLNPLDGESFAALRDACTRARDHGPTALVITGTGDAFTAGGDLRWFAEMAVDRPNDLRRVLTEAAHALWSLEDLAVPVIAGVNGVCVAGGMEIICFSDLVIAARRARFADGHASVGLLPVAGSASRLCARVGHAHANRLLLKGEFIDAAEALQIGLVGQVVDDDSLIADLEASCAALAERPPAVLAALVALTRQVDETRRRVRRQELDTALANVGQPHVAASLLRFLDGYRPAHEIPAATHGTSAGTASTIKNEGPRKPGSVPKRRDGLKHGQWLNRSALRRWARSSARSRFHR